VSITSPVNGATYPVGLDSTWQLSAQVSDAQHGPEQLTYAWLVTLHHNNHDHPDPLITTPTATAVTRGEGCDGQTYYYEVALTVTDAHGLSTTVAHQLLPRCYAIAPTAVINVSSIAGYAPFQVQFDGSASYDPGTIVSYSWDFGDGTFNTLPAPLKTYTESGDRLVTLTVTDNDGLTGTAARLISVVDVQPPQCPGTAGGLLREFWSNVGGSAVLDLLNHPAFPGSPSGSNIITSFQGPTNIGNNYGTRVRGWIVPPETGPYTFTVTSDDASAVYLSLNAEARFRRLICSVPGNTLAAEFDKYSSQVSEPILLQAGAHYYVELLHKEGNGNDHFALYWQTPSNNDRVVVPGSALVHWQDCPPGTRLRAILGGAYSETAARMRDDLRAAGLVPLAEPYTGLGYAFTGGGGGEAVPAQRLEQTGSNAVVDWMVVELRDKNNPAQVVASRAALIERDGDLVGTDGFARLNFNVPAGEYFVAIRHRNHLAAMTGQAVRLSADETAVDFSLQTTPAWGTNGRASLPRGRVALWMGDANRDGVLRYVGLGNDRDKVLVAVGGSMPTGMATGYRTEDVNLDGVVRYVGSGNDRDPILMSIGGATPTAVRQQQLP
ncbi:MAG: PKD domain-containing protein, partial [Flavobacteriales bacterium]